jgi:N-acetylmuramoyl-L-alanine amidase
LLLLQRLILLLGAAIVAFGLGLAAWQGIEGSRPRTAPEAAAEETSGAEEAVEAGLPGAGESRPTSTTTRTIPSRLVPATTARPSASSATTAPAVTAPAAAAPAVGSSDDGQAGPGTRKEVVVAWQPSHQDDTGGPGWHEYLICGDIAQRTIAMLNDSRVHSVLAWETEMGLTGSNNAGSNAPAFDSEIRQANEAGAHYFVSLHNDGGAPSGVLGMFFSGDQRSAEIAERYTRAVSEQTGLPYRGVRGAPLYSLDPVRNRAPIRVLLEIGDNERDRAFLEDETGREKIARALAGVTERLAAP